MALSARLVMRQGQSLVMTPQLLQAIKLLQLSSLELASYIEEELERNPLLERVDDRLDAADLGRSSDPVESAADDVAERDWTSSELEVDVGALEANLGTELDNAFEADRTAPASEPIGPAETGTARQARAATARPAALKAMSRARPICTISCGSSLPSRCNRPWSGSSVTR
jgi:DNA-directed RNA polymerase specialized sigma54-like protein